MQFDKVIMNPPYIRTLHIQVMNEVSRHLVSDGTIVNLSPVRWIQDPTKEYKENSTYFKYKHLAEQISDVELFSQAKANKLFRIYIPQPLGIYTIGTRPSGAKLFYDPLYEKIISKIVYNDNFSKQDAKFYTEDLQNFVLVNMFAEAPKYGRPQFDGLKRYCGYFIDGKNADGQTYPEAKEGNWRINNGDISQDIAICFKTGEEAKNCFEAFDTTFARFVCVITTVDAHCNQKFLPWMDDYTEPWTNERFRESFEITNEEWQQIVDMMTELGDEVR